MTTPEIPRPEEPDEFGMIPPQSSEGEEGPRLPPNPAEPQTPSSELGEFPHPEKSEFYFPPHIPVHREILPQLDQAKLDFFESLAIEAVKGYLWDSSAYFGGLGKQSPDSKPESEPAEERDPYPSRAGWRANFLSPFDPSAEELKDKPKGKIGEYEIIESATTFEDVGGNIHAKDLLAEIAAQFETPELYAKWDVPVPKGVLLHGMPGTGKTMLAKAFANKANAAFIEVPVASLRDKYYGESEKSLKNVFDQAAQYEGQVVIFFDEIDSLLINRAQTPAGSPDAKLVNTFLQAMDGMSSAPNVMVLGATNYPNRLDRAATRPGRFDQKVEVELPDRAGCGEIAAKQLLKAERSAKRVLVEDELALDEIGRLLEGLSGADVAEIMNRVKRTMAQTERAMKKQEGLPENAAFTEHERDVLRVTTEDIVAITINYRMQKRK